MKRGRMKKRLILILILFSAIIISTVIAMLYYNLVKTILGFNNVILESNKKIIKQMLITEKAEAKELILSINGSVLRKTRNKLEIFVNKASKENNHALLELFAKTIDSEFKFLELEILEIVNRTEFKWGIEYGERAILEKKLSEDNMFLGFLVYNRDEEIPFKMGEIAENRISRKLLESRGESRIYYSEVQSDNTVYVGMVIYDEDKNYSGYLISKINLKKVLDQLFKGIELGAERAFYIVGNRSKVIKHKNMNKEGKKFNDLDLENIIFNKNTRIYQNTINNSIYTLYKYNYRNIRLYIVSQEYISDAFSDVDAEELEREIENTINESFEEYDKKVDEKMHESYIRTTAISKEKLTHFRKTLFGAVEFVAFFGIIISILIGVILANYVTHPVNELSHIVKKIGGGNLEEEIDKKLISRKDEIGDLAKEFTEMKYRIKNDIIHIRDLERKKVISERLSMMGQMVSGIVHEIKNPLTSISGFAQIIESVTEDEMLKKHAHTIVDESMRLNKLARNLLSYAKVENLEKETCDIKKLIKGSVEKLYPNIQEKKVKVFVNLDDEIPILSVDKDKLTQVFINIVSNAIEAINHENGIIMIGGEAYNESLFIRIRDNGPGISDDIKEKIFIPFISSKKSGTGLGLAMVKKIIEDHEGQIYINSELSQGTEFIIKLPVDKA
jgi:signal transduction histidine kinase